MSTLFRSISRAFNSRTNAESPNGADAQQQPQHQNPPFSPSQSQSQPPKTPSPALRLDALKVLCRLELIPEFRPYLYAHEDFGVTQSSRTDKFRNAVKILWFCFVLGKPLCVLLDLLGSPSGRTSLGAGAGSSSRFGLQQNGANLEDEESRLYFQSFLERLHVLEVQRQVPYGEVLRESDLWDGTTTGFGRVLKTVRRLLTALQESYPGLYRLASHSAATVDRVDVLKNLIHSERAYLTELKDIYAALGPLQATLPPNTLHPCLDLILSNETDMLSWHEELVTALEELHGADGWDSCNWQAIFRTTSPLASITIRSHRAICANWDWVGLSGIRGSLVQLLALPSPPFSPQHLHPEHQHQHQRENQEQNQQLLDDAQLRQHIKLLLKILPTLPTRIDEYIKRLGAILDISLPPLLSITPPTQTPIPEQLSRMPSMSSLISTSTASSSVSSSPSIATITPSSSSLSFYRIDPYDTLLTTLFELCDISANIDEMCEGFREIGVLELLKPHLSFVDVGKLGGLLLDDRVVLQASYPGPHDGEINPTTPCSLFLFEHVLLCFLEIDQPQFTDLDLQIHQQVDYPILPWQMGAASRRIEVINNQAFEEREGERSREGDGDGVIALQLIHAIRTEDLRVLRYSENHNHAGGGPAFEIEWASSSSSTSPLPENGNHILQFTTPTNEQQNQWCEALEGFVHAVSVLRATVPRNSHSSSSHPNASGPPAYYPTDAFEDDYHGSDYSDEYQHPHHHHHQYSDDDSASYPPSLQFDPHLDLAVLAEDGRRSSYPRPWSLIARKGPRSEASSFVQQQQFLVEDGEGEGEEQISPGLMPSLGVKSRPLSPNSVNGNGNGRTHHRQEDEFVVNHKRSSLSSIASSTDFPREPRPNGHIHAKEDSDSTIKGTTTTTNGTTSTANGRTSTPALLDLTGKIVKLGRFPEAHGGFSDIWKGVWREGDGEVKVAIKVLRSKVDDPLVEVERLKHELTLWSSLNPHPNILPLYGTTSDFGNYESMVCPWLEFGSVSRYMEMRGDILSMRDRLQLLCEVAEGLRYLHSFSIVHGDLSGANILINNKGKACLADFGLSSMVAECRGTTFFTSNIGGAVRWADPSLYRLPPLDDAIVEDPVDYETEVETKEPVMGTWCDIYSFGSVTLELLSGRIPYHYIRSDAQVLIELHKGIKPRRPAPSFVTETQWEFIRQCWLDEPKERPDIEEVCQGVQDLLRVCVESNFRKRASVRSART